MIITNCPKCGSFNITTAGVCANCGWLQFAQVTVSTRIVGDCNTRPIEDELRKRIAELEAFIEQLIEAGNALDVPPDDFSEEQKDWRELVNEWKERER